MTSTIVTNRNIGQLGAIRRLSAGASATGGGAGDAATVTGATIDRMGFGLSSLPMSLALGVVYEGALATGKTLSVAYQVQDSADGTTWADYATSAPAIVATGSTASSAIAGQLEAAIDLSSARRYVRANFVPDLSATQTDTASFRAVGFFAGFDRIPA